MSGNPVRSVFTRRANAQDFLRRHVRRGTSRRSREGFHSGGRYLTLVTRRRIHVDHSRQLCLEGSDREKDGPRPRRVTMRTSARCFLLFGLAAAVPRVAAAQAILAGEVKDTTGAVLPGVTVEAASP